MLVSVRRGSNAPVDVVADLVKREPEIVGPKINRSQLESVITSAADAVKAMFTCQEEPESAGGWLPFRLSPLDTISKNAVGRTGFEPVTSSVSGKSRAVWVSVTVGLSRTGSP